MKLTFHETGIGISNICSRLRAHIKVAEITRARIFHCFVVRYLSIWEITFISKQHYDNSWPINVARYLLIPLFYCLKALSIGCIEDKKSTDCLFIEYRRNRSEFFLPECVPNMELCPLVCAINFEHFPADLHLSWLFFSIIERIFNKSLDNWGFSDSGLADQDQFIVEIGAIFVKNFVLIAVSSPGVWFHHHVIYYMLYILV